MSKEHVCNNLCKLRKEHSLTQQALADAVGVSRQSIISIEKGNYTPSVLLALKIAEALKTKVEKIFSLNETSS